MADKDKEQKIYDEVEAPPRNESLYGQKSTQAHPEEAKQEKRLGKENPANIADRQPEEIKATTNILPEDAERKSKSSEEQAL